MDFDEVAESAVAKRTFLLNRLMKRKLLPDDDDDEEVAEGEVLGGSKGFLGARARAIYTRHY